MRLRELTGKTKLELNGALPQTATSLTNIGLITVEIKQIPEIKEGADKIMKKKIMTALMCAALALSAGNTVLAETVTGDGSSSAGTDVTGTYQASTPSTVYNVTITCGQHGIYLSG